MAKNTEGTSAYTCDNCAKIFKRENLKKYHQKTCGDIHSCGEEGCNKTFKSPKTLKEHTKIHSKELMCETCSACFSKISNLKKHKLTHNKDEGKQYKCKTCSKAFHSKNGLKGHEENHS